MSLKLKLVDTFKICIWAEMSKVLLLSGTLVFAKALAGGECFAPYNFSIMKHRTQNNEVKLLDHETDAGETGPS